MAKLIRPRRAAAYLALLAALCLPGCAVFGGAGGGVEALLRAPRLSGETSAVQRALTDHLGSGITFRYPASGDFLTPFLFGDWDGDGTQEAAALYTAADTANVSLAVLEPAGDGWRVTQTVEGLSGEVETMHTARLRDSASLQLLVGYGSAQGDRYLCVYLYSEETLQTVISQAYETMLLTDITGDPETQDLILALPSEGENAGVTLQLLTNTEEGFHSAQTQRIGEGQFTACVALHAGTAAGGMPYLLVDGWSGSSAGSLFSCFVTYNAETGFLNTWLPDGVNDPYAETLRWDTTLTSRDIDGDGDIDIPTELSGAGTLAAPLDRSLRFLVWQDHVGRLGGSSTFGIYDTDNRLFLPLPNSMRGHVRVRANAAGTGWLVGSDTVSGSYCELRVVDPADAPADERYQRIANIGSQQLQARIIRERTGLTLQAITDGVLLL